MPNARELDQYNNDICTVEDAIGGLVNKKHIHMRQKLLKQLKGQRICYLNKG